MISIPIFLLLNFRHKRQPPFPQIPRSKLPGIFDSLKDMSMFKLICFYTNLLAKEIS